MSLESLTVYESAAYFDTLCSLIARTSRGSRIAIMTMAYEQDQPHVARLMTKLVEAASRGVQVHLLVDAFSFTKDQYQLPTGPAIRQRPISTSQSKYFQQRYHTLEQLREQGGHYAVINGYNKFPTNPFGGRSHIKLAVVDNVGFIGGCNLDAAQIDYMVRFEHPSTVNWLYDFALQVAEQKSVRQVLHDTDQSLAIDEKTTVFIDSGKPKQSIIYQSALEFIDSAQEWLVMTCQYFPNTVTGEHLAAAVKRGVRVVLYYNHPYHHAPHARPMQRSVIILEKMRRPKELFAHQLPKDLQRIHAKLLASEQGAIIGSHNYVTHGVNFGTAEIALRQYSKTFARDALAVLKQRLPADYAADLPLQ